MTDMETYCDRRKREARDRLVLELAKPFKAPPRSDGLQYSDDDFDPWNLFPAVYGSYDEEFDICAIDVLAGLRDGGKRRHDLGSEMFREMLCTAGFCDYGTSPRSCFWQLDDALLAELIDKWRSYSRREWQAGE